MTPVEQRVTENYHRVLGRIERSAARSGRRASDIMLVAVTKYVSVDLVYPLLDAGCTSLGESRPQELWVKAAAIAADWHLVGPLQRNKVKRTVPLVSTIHSVDGLKLLEALSAVCASQAHRLRVLLEVNVSRDERKHGWLPEEMPSIVESLSADRYLEVCGLMTMGTLAGGRARAAADFAALRQLRDRLQPACPAGIHLTELSMGMSADFDVAIEQGATIVRIGTALFEGCL
jgi:hypothetical protein